MLPIENIPDVESYPGGQILKRGIAVKKKNTRGINMFRAGWVMRK